jgi:hypothetical protein
MGLCVVCAAIFMTFDAIARMGADIPVKVTATTIGAVKAIFALLAGRRYLAKTLNRTSQARAEEIQK